MNYSFYPGVQRTWMGWAAGWYGWLWEDDGDDGGARTHIFVAEMK